MCARAFLLLPILAALAGCPAGAEDVRPPEDEFYFPTGLAVSPDQRYLFVTNANSDLRFGSSSLQVVDLDVVGDLLRGWVDEGTIPGGCQQELDRRETISCSEENDSGNAGFLLGDRSVRVGNFVGELRIQELDDGGLRLFMPVRGDPSVTWADFDGASAEFDCGGSGSYPRCDGDHQLVQMRANDDFLPLSEEPFGIHVDGENGYVVVTHLTSGNISLATTPSDRSTPPELVDAKGGFFQPSPTTGARGAVAAAGRLPGAPNDLVYVTSGTESRVQMFHVAKPVGNQTHPLLVPSDFFFLSAVFPSQDTRGIVFSSDGSRAHIVNRRPPTLTTVDTTLDDAGRPSNEVLQSTEICRQAGLLTVSDNGEGDRLYVSCFRNGQIWVIEPETATIEALIDVGRGPHSVVAAPSRNQIYVANFLEHTVAVIDTTPGAATEHRVVVRLGDSDFGDDN